MGLELAFVDPGQIAIFIPIIAVSIPIVAIVLKHHQRLVELKLQMLNQGDTQLAAQLQSLQKEISELRDTSTRYDMSFDSALQRIEHRVGTLETRVNDVERAANVQVTK